MKNSMVSTWTFLIMVIALAFVFSGCALLTPKQEQRVDDHVEEIRRLVCVEAPPEVREELIRGGVEKRIIHPDICLGI